MEVKGPVLAIFPGDVNLKIKDGPMFVHTWVWTNYTDPDHKVRITDRDGNEVFSVRGSLNFDDVSFEGGCMPIWEPFVAQLDSGQLSIYLK